MTTARSRWRRDDGRRAEAVAARDAAAEAFYELDTAQRELRLSVETITAVDRSPAGRKAAADFERLGSRIDEVSGAYIAAVDAHDLDAAELDPAVAVRARSALAHARQEIIAVKAELDRFAQSLGPMLTRAENELARLAPAVERARRALREATAALDAVRAAGLAADGIAARLAALAPELTRLNEGAKAHGVAETIRRAEDVQRRAEQIAAEAAGLPQRVAELDKRLVSLRTRAQALATRAEGVGPTLSELRRRFSAACWQDLQQVPQQAAAAVERAERQLADAQRLRDGQRWADAAEAVASVRELLTAADRSVAAAGDRLRRLDEVGRDPQAEIERTRFAVRDAQRLAMQGRSRPDPRHAEPLDGAVLRLERAVAALTGRHPDYWSFLTECEAVRRTSEQVVAAIREERAARP